MTMASPFVAVLAVWAAASCAMIISCQESGHYGHGGQLQEGHGEQEGHGGQAGHGGQGGHSGQLQGGHGGQEGHGGLGGHGGQEGHGLHGGRVKRQQGPNSIDFLVKEDQTATRQIVLHDIKLHCEIIFGIKIKPIAPTKQEYDYEDYVEENKNKPAGEAGEVRLTLTHPNFRDGQEEIIVSVDENGSGRKKETVCFKYCANITEYTQIISLSAKSDLKSTVDVEVVQEKGNHECQKDKIITKVVFNETYKEIAETNEKKAETYKTEADENKTVAIIFVICFVMTLAIAIVAIVLLFREKKKRKDNKQTTSKEDEIHHGEDIAMVKTAPVPGSRNIKRGTPSAASRKEVKGDEERYRSHGDDETAMISESETPSQPSGSRNIERCPTSALRWEEVEIKRSNKGMTGSQKLCSRYRFLMIATFISLLLAFIFAILSALALF